jgi:hypothetical protein
MRHGRSRSGNKRIAALRLGSALIAIFAEHSTPFTLSTIILTWHDRAIRPRT